MDRRTERSFPAVALTLSAAMASAAVPPAQTLVRASVSSTGAQADAHTPLRASATCMSVSADGRFVAFVTAASSLVPGDTNGVDDVFVRDLFLGTTARVSVSSSGQQALADRYGRGCFDAAISGDGRYVSFSTAGTKLIDGEKGGGSRVDVYVRDRVAGTTERVSVSTSGGAPNGDSAYASISADGRYVAFYSHATNLVANDLNRTSDVFVRDRVARTTARASVDSAGRAADGSSLVTTNSALSADGRCVVFVSAASNLVGGDTNGAADVFVRDLAAGSTERVNLSASGGQLAGGVALGTQSISGDGRCVTYVSNAPDQMPAGAPRNDPSNPTSSYCYQAFQFDRVARTTAIVSREASGELADRGVGAGMVGSSADGRYLSFVSRSTNLVPGYAGDVSAVFLRDGATGAVILVEVGLGGSSPDGPAWPFQSLLDAAGHTVVFAAEATNLVVGDTNGVRDVFVVGG
jgi:Tol biopolymer transport system component